MRRCSSSHIGRYTRPGAGPARAFHGWPHQQPGKKVRKNRAVRLEVTSYDKLAYQLPDIHDLRSHAGYPGVMLRSPNIGDPRKKRVVHATHLPSNAGGRQTTSCSRQDPAASGTGGWGLDLAKNHAKTIVLLCFSAGSGRPRPSNPLLSRGMRGAMTRSFSPCVDSGGILQSFCLIWCSPLYGGRAPAPHAEGGRVSVPSPWTGEGPSEEGKALVSTLSFILVCHVTRAARRPPRRRGTRGRRA